MGLKVFNDLAELEPAQVEALLKLARRLQDSPEPRALEGKVLALLFLSPSLRTLSSTASRPATASSWTAWRPSTCGRRSR